MNTSAWVITAVVALLIAGVFFAGCSDDSAKAGDSSSQPAVTTAVTTFGALYSEGDVVKNPKSTLSTGLLIIAYDAGSDMYERATIYPYSDGSWGYRIDTKTTKVSRASLEKVYTEKVGTVTVSSVHIGAPTTATTVATTAATQATTAVTATETTESTTAPKINDIDPFIGTAGTTVSVTDLKGSNFVSGATVALTKSGETSISATDVSVSSPTKITCKFALPLSTVAGSWNVVVTNPDKQAYTSSNLFTVYKNSSATATATATSTGTTTTSATTVTITNMDPSAKFNGDLTSPVIVDIYGTNLSAGSKVAFTQGSTTRWSSEYNIVGTNARIKIDLSSGATIGYMTVTVYDSNNNILGSKVDAFQIVG